MLNVTDVEFDGKHIKDYYKDYNEYYKYLEKHYIHWNQFTENDQNVTFKEFKQGKRNEK